MRWALLLILLMTASAVAAQNETDESDNGTDGEQATEGFDFGTLRIVSFGVAAVLIGVFVYVARR